MSGRLIGPKTRNRIVEIFGARFGQSTNCLGSLGVIYAINYVLVCMRPEVTGNLMATPQ